MLKDAREASDAFRIHDKKNDHVSSDIFQVHIDGTSGFIKIEYPTTVLKQAIEGRTQGNNTKSMLTQLKDSLSSRTNESDSKYHHESDIFGKFANNERR